MSFAQGMGPLALAPMFPYLIEAFDSDLASVVQFTGVCILVLGFSNFFWYCSLVSHYLSSITHRPDLKGSNSRHLWKKANIDLLYPHLSG